MASDIDRFTDQAQDEQDQPLKLPISALVLDIFLRKQTPTVIDKARITCFIYTFFMNIRVFHKCNKSLQYNRVIIYKQ